MPSCSVFLDSPYENVLDLSKGILWVLVGQRAAKMQGLKVCTIRESNPDCWKSSYSSHKVAKKVASDPKGLDFFQLLVTLIPFEVDA